MKDDNNPLGYGELPKIGRSFAIVATLLAIVAVIAVVSVKPGAICDGARGPVAHLFAGCR